MKAAHKTIFRQALRAIFDKQETGIEDARQIIFIAEDYKLGQEFIEQLYSDFHADFGEAV